MFNGGIASSLNQDPRFKVIEIDAASYMPQKITTWAFDIEKANTISNPTSSDLLYKVNTYPDNYADITDLRPSQMATLASAIQSQETKALEYLV